MYFNLRGVCIIIYIDDILILSDSFDDCIKDAQFVIDKLIELGFQIKTEKCVLTPSQHFFILGYLWDSNMMTCELPEEKLLNIKSLCKEILADNRVRVRLMQRLMGCVISTRPAVPMSRARSRGIQRMVLDHYKGTPSSAGKLVCLTKWAREDVLWWLGLDIKMISTTRSMVKELLIRFNPMLEVVASDRISVALLSPWTRLTRC